MSIKKKRLSIGHSDFKRLITDSMYFVDKSLFIKDVVEGMAVLLYPRPRRFGKTLNLSMLRYFYDITEDNAHLFKNLMIYHEEDIMAKQGKHPVIFLTFKDIKSETYDACLEKIFTTVSRLYKEHQNIILSEDMSYEDKEFYKKILSTNSKQTDLEESLKYLSQFLFQHYKANPVILIDEYDTPIHAGFYHGYYDKIVNFMKSFLGGGLKDNTYLEKGVLTGIMRVSKESIFSDLNNISVLSMLSKKSADKFGFTHPEVELMLDYYESSVNITEVKKHYDGYNFRGVEIYNPWSILNCIDTQSIGLFWANTSSNNLIKEMCSQADETVKQDLMVILEGGIVRKYIDENIVFTPSLLTPQTAGMDNHTIWNFLLMSGYFRYDNYIMDGEIRPTNADLSIPNKEILALFVMKIIPEWFASRHNTESFVDLTHHLINGDIEVFKKEFTDFCINSFSYFDVSGDNPEKFYHGFVLGVFTCLKDAYQIKSNRESGLGRYDILLIPNDLSGRGIIFEFKILNHERGETFPQALRSGKKQLIEQKYAQELQALGIEDIISLVAVFKGKEVQID